MSVLVRNLGDLKAAKLVPKRHPTVVGRVKRWVAVLDAKSEREMHLTVPKQERASLLRILFGHDPTASEIYWRPEVHTDVIEIGVAKLKSMDPVRVREFFRETAAAALRHNKLV